MPILKILSKEDRFYVCTLQFMICNARGVVICDNVRIKENYFPFMT